MPATLPELFGRYRIVKKLGEGGMGAVYLAEDTRMRRQVALKVPHFRENEDPRTLERFYREARLAGQITHANLCPVHDVDCVDGVHFLTMAYIEGTPLDHYVGRDRPWPAANAVVLVRQLTAVLGLLHAKGIVHRDLKPGNVMIRADGTPILMDFGLARSFAANSQHLTTQGKPMGTPAFMSPEQVNGEEQLIGPHTDVWALGVLLYQLLTGQLPFVGQTPMELWSGVLFREPPPPSTLVVGLDTRLDAVCARALTKDPQQRPATMAALDELLTAPAPAVRTAPKTMVPTMATSNPVSDQLPTSPTGWLPTMTPAPQPSRGALPMWGLTALMTAGVAGVVLVLLVLVGAFTPSQQANQTTNHPPPSTPARQAVLRLSPLEECALTEGEQRDVPVRIERTNWDGEVSLVPLDVPNNLRVTATPIASGATTGSVQVRALSGSAGRHTLRLRALGGDNLRQEQTLTVVVRPTVAPPVAALKLTLPAEATVTAGESTTIVVEIKRSNFEGEVKLLPDVQAEGITLRLSPIADGKTSINVRIEADAKAKLGKHKVGILARGPGVVHDEGTFTVEIKPAAVVAKDEFTNCIGMKFKLIPKGNFKMGSSAEDRKKVEQHFKDIGLKPEDYKEYFDWEQPQHEVEITKEFYMGVYEVTQEEWETVMGKDENRSYFRKGGDGEKKVEGLDTRRFPVETVSWDDTKKFLAKLNERAKEKGENYLYRLPTEAEWEYACRGGSTSLFHFGDKLTYKEANFNWNYPFGSTDKKTYLGRPVAVDEPGYQANKFGLYHMHGNVWEWCSDRFDATYYQTRVDQKIRQDPQGPQDEKINRFVLRGGSWYYGAWDCRSADRYRSDPGYRLYGWGFRVVCVRTR